MHKNNLEGGLIKRFIAGAGLTTYLAYGIFIVGGILSITAPFHITEYFIYGSAAASLIGLSYFLLSKLAVKRIIFPSISEQDFKKYMKDYFPIPFVVNRPLLPLLLAQILFLLLSWVFFYTMEFQTRINARVQVLEPGTLIELMQTHPWTLCLCPWICFAICGVGLAYLSISLSAQRTPTIASALFPKHLRQPGLFFHNYCKIVVDTVLLGPPVFLFALTTIWCAETVSLSFGWTSLFLYPWKSTIAFLLIVLVFRNSHRKFLDTLLQRKIPLGGILALYAMGIGLFLFWVHSFGSWFTFGFEATDPNQVMKSPLAGNFSQEELTHRLHLLIWGWWAIWVPQFASLIARLSIGRKIYEACLQAIVLPTILFLFILPRLDTHFLQVLFPTNLSIVMHWIIMFFLFFALMMIFGQTHTTADIVRGAMPKNIGKRMRAHSLNKWFMSMMAVFICYVTGEYVLAWVPSQVVVTLGAIFMISVVFIFLAVLFSTKDHYEVAKKYKAPSES